MIPAFLHPYTYLRSQIIFGLIILVLMGCSKETQEEPDMDPAENSNTELYFPGSGNSEDWEEVSPLSLGWNTSIEDALDSYLAGTGTRAFIILKNGRIARERYFGSFTKDSLWYWASAGKTLTAFTVGLAQQEQLLSIQDPTSNYLGVGWTSATPEQEEKIKILNQLQMTSGLNELYFDCTDPSCLTPLTEAGTRWAYHNGPYTLLQDVVASAAGENYSSYFNRKLRNPIGMNGLWISTNGNNSVFYSNARSMARFGLLILAQGTWDGSQILENGSYFNQMLSPSQEINEAYGYLWWLNGQNSYMLPSSRTVFQGTLVPSAPEDLVSGLGKNDQKLYVVPSLNLVVIRMGSDSGENQAGPSSFDNTLWGYLSDYLNL